MANNLEGRIEDLENREKRNGAGPGQQFLRLADLPKETVVEAFRILIECGAMRVSESQTFDPVSGPVPIDPKEITDDQLWELAINVSPPL